MKNSNLMLWGAAFLLSAATVSCDSADHRQNEAQEQTGSPTLRDDNNRAANPQSHVDTKDGVDAGVTGSGQIGDDGTMRSGKNIVENATSHRDLSTFASVLRHGDMVATLNGTGPYTVFAPTNSAFENLSGNNSMSDLMKAENKPQLQQLLNNHVVAGKLTADQLQDGAMLKTVGGQQLQVRRQGNQVTVNGANVVEANTESSNGVVHLIDQVITQQ